MFALSYLEPQELVAQTDEITRDQPVGPAQLQERSVRAPEVCQAPVAVAVGDLRMTARHELVLGEHDVALLATEVQIRARQMVDVA